MGLRLKQSPPEIYLQNFEKKYAVSRLNVIISGGIYKKKHEKRNVSYSTHVCQIKWAEP